ncbi:MAG: ClbS/DfsB family four-helix bundle protein [Cohaesibacteraceae bacterium]|nr:ClbS/DfsB family four-helix bundle protein [Cohaesibacteraceae bacterium]MBL4874896.1 ClbS/DfsB family four-helix bundle protein [Cohaesibacteraceae bacterium]
MPASNKIALLQITRVEYQKLSKQLDSLDSGLVMHKHEDVSIRDIVGHRAHWVDLMLGWYRDGQAGRQVFFPAKGYKWNQLKVYNAQIGESQKGMNWISTLDMLDTAHRKLVTLLESLSDEQLYGAPMKGAHNQWTTGRWAEANGASHYRSASKAIRAISKS